MQVTSTTYAHGMQCGPQCSKPLQPLVKIGCLYVERARTYLVHIRQLEPIPNAVCGVAYRVIVTVIPNAVCGVAYRVIDCAQVYVSIWIGKQECSISREIGRARVGVAPSPWYVRQCQRRSAPPIQCPLQLVFLIYFFIKETKTEVRTQIHCGLKRCHSPPTLLSCTTAVPQYPSARVGLRQHSS